MNTVCFYFQVHQPFRLRRYSLFDIGTAASYFDDDKNRAIVRKVAHKCYLPMNALLLDLLERFPLFQVTFSISGTALEQFRSCAPDVLLSFLRLVRTGRVELLAETYYHSLSCLYDADEFKAQVRQHHNEMKTVFGYEPRVFRNTELIYNNALAETVHDMRYSAVLAEGADTILRGRSPNNVYRAHDVPLKVLLKNYQLSDDIAFRFSDKHWEGHPLTAKKFVQWLSPLQGDTVNLFMDYETFGEHQWADTGIFTFIKNLVPLLLKKEVRFVTPSELTNVTPNGVLDVRQPVSWADTERDISAWTGNKMQQDALRQLYQLRTHVLNHGDLLPIWRKLTTSDHFYYMCVKWFSDGDVHKYFNPHDSPYDAFIAFMNVLQDLTIRVNALGRRYTDELTTGEKVTEL